MPEIFTNDDSSTIDYSPLRTNIKIDRWSPLAVLVYILTGLIIFITLFILGALITDFYLPATLLLLIAIIVSALSILGSRALFRRKSPAQTDDLFAFAEANKFSIQTNPPTTDLSAVVRIMMRYAWLYEPLDWRYVINLCIEGNFKSYPISLYNVALDFSTTADSTIEGDMTKAYYATQDAQASITLTTYQGGAGPLALRELGLILWTIPDISPETVKIIKRALWRHVSDIQTDGKQLAILLPTALPYERKKMIKLFRVLDRIHAATERTT